MLKNAVKTSAAVKKVNTMCEYRK